MREAGQYSRGSDDDFCVNEVLVEFRALTFLVRGGDELVTLLLDPFPQAKLVFGGAEETGLLFGVLVALKSVNWGHSTGIETLTS